MDTATQFTTRQLTEYREWHDGGEPPGLSGNCLA